MPKTFTLSPSDFGFLYSECKRCYYNKYVHKKLRPKYSMPGIFTVIDNLMTKAFDNKPTSLISDSLKPGIVTLGGLMVRSKPIKCQEYDCNIVIDGRVDSLMKFDDDTMGILDFKTTIPMKSSLDFYFSQLMSYYVALSHNDPSKTKPCTVSEMGLCCFIPEAFEAEKSTGIGLLGCLEWQPIPIDMPKFKAFLKDVAALLTGDIPPLNDDCKFCRFQSDN